MGTRIVPAMIALLVTGASLASAGASTPPFRFDKDTFAFGNMTVFEYQNGVARLRHGEDAKKHRYTRRCFVLSRAAMQFRKFARFDPKAPALNDQELARRVRAVTRISAWRPALPLEQRIMIPGYANLRALSAPRGRILQDNVGLGWPTYWRVGNYRIFAAPGVSYQKRMLANLNAAMSRGDLFVAYLTTLPRLSINHAVLIYKKKAAARAGEERYIVYDPNHPEAPRVLTWNGQNQRFEYQKDWDFIGGPVRVYQVYGKPLQ